ncbi:MAG: cytidylate kinase [Candidatus Cloacimonadota bacterium]|nr:MAG: cytidylate kinase [Candidatus Cloacimonadota bacterium]PIE77466.1 MAG: cytidylate kinase [Candidatus Delongbacteria bacterium]
MIIAIDGPAASGKSTTAKIVGEKLNFLYIDTGAMYRAMTLKVKNSGVDFTDRKGIVDLISSTKISQTIDEDSGLTKTFLDGEDVSNFIRTPEISRGVGSVCEIFEVREALVKLQREMGNSCDVILDGRDIGTVVFPNADLKFWMVADVDIRASRRYEEMKEKNPSLTIEDVKNDLIERDRRDSERLNSPMKPADDAIFIDTSNYSISEQADLIVSEVLKLKSRL